MSEKIIKEYYGHKNLAKIVFPATIKTWDIQRQIKKEFIRPLKNIKQLKVDASDKATVKILPLVKAAKIWQKKYFANLKNSDWTTMTALATIKNHWLIDVHLQGKAKLAWSLAEANQAGIYFNIHGQGEIVISEQQKNSLLQNVQIDVGEGIKLNYNLIKNQSRGFSWLSYRANIFKQGSCVWEVGIKNKSLLIGSFALHHQGSGVEGNHLFGGRFSNQSKTYLNFINQHLVANTTGDMFIKTIGEDNAQTIVEGLIAIGSKSANTNSYLKEDTLLLSSEARASALPNLEILNQDVKASHGATVGRIDEQMLYYLVSRGLNLSAAKELIVAGFFHTLGSRINDKDRQSKILDLLLDKK